MASLKKLLSKNNQFRTRHTSLFFVCVLVIGLLASSLKLFPQSSETLERGRELYKKGNYTEAVKVLESYARAVDGNSAQAKNYAEANYLLAKIFYEAGDDQQTDSHLLKALQADRSIGDDETVDLFKQRSDRLLSSLPEPRPAKKSEFQGWDQELRKMRETEGIRVSGIKPTKYVRIARIEKLLSKTGIKSLEGPCDKQKNYLVKTDEFLKGTRCYLFNMETATLTMVDSEFTCEGNFWRGFSEPFEINKVDCSTLCSVKIRETLIEIDGRSRFGSPKWAWVDVESFLFSNYGGVGAGQGGIWRIWIESY